MLASFLADRGEHYTRAMSSPLTAEHACSRLSPHLALGSLSMREAAQAAWAQQRALADAPRSAETARWGQAVRSFLARLHWHCHFIQKLESEPEAEVRPFARAYEGLRPQPGDPHRLAAFATGRTGYPFIDACLRALIATGWINFRMRAMLMSFASYDLWLPWQESGLVLARLFTDYEPGIHWPQCQMQSGETGINTVRVYSPVKQSQEQDPDGVFIRRWVPELARVPLAQLHTPWQLGPAERAALCPDYPERIVVHEAAVAEAKARLFAVRRQPEARSQANAVQRKHGSRKRTADRRRAGAAAARQASPQLALDLD
jgi:deoxyribodipyrimidine photo-lyase